MQEQLITFETAQLAKQKGFDLEVLHFYCKNETCNHLEVPNKYSFEVNANNDSENNFGYGLTWSAPTQSFLQAWLRNIKGIEITIIPNYIYIVFPLKRMTDALDKLEGDQTIDLLDLASETEYKTYEEALEVALVEALKMI